jgi:hypothetical protein
MFSEQQFISDFIDANFASNQDFDLDYEDVREQIAMYVQERIYTYTSEDLKEIAIVYDTYTEEFKEIIKFFRNVECSPDDFQIRAEVALEKLQIKILTEYMQHECSDAGTEYGDDEDYGGEDDEIDEVFLDF